ncbi:MAG: inorganic diphosphatase [Bacteroidota bacterium]
MAHSTPFDDLPPFPAANILNVIVETPAGWRCKLKYEAATGLLTLSKYLPAGLVFPFDFGFVPGTRGDDGDPLDVMLLAEAGSAPGCLIPARLLGVLQAAQTKADGRVVRNDRLLAVPLASRAYAGLNTLGEIPRPLCEQIEHFLASYGALEGDRLEITARRGPKTASKLIRQASGGH